jgi:hypothetical protein
MQKPQNIKTPSKTPQKRQKKTLNSEPRERGIPVTIRGRIQGRFREDSGNMRGRIQGTSEREDSKNIQGTFREHSGNIQGTIKGTSKEESGRNQGGIREESERNQGT